MQRPQQQRHQQQRQQQQRQFFRSDNDTAEMQQQQQQQQQQNYRMPNNRRRVGVANNGRPNHRNNNYHSNSTAYHSRNHSTRNGSSQTSFSYRTEPILSRSSSRTLIRTAGYNGHTDVGQHPCSVQQRPPPPPPRTVSNPPSTLQPQPHMFRMQQISASSPIQTNFVGFPCYSIIVPPSPIPDSIPGYLQQQQQQQQQPGYVYGEVDLQSNLQLCPIQPTKYFIPVVQHICPIPSRFLPKMEHRKRHHALDIIDPVTQRNIFDSRMENGTKEPLARLESRSEPIVTYLPSLEPPKCVTRSVVAVPNQIQAAAAIEEGSQSGEKDLESLKLVDILQHHNISEILPDDTDSGEVSKVDLLESEAKPKSTEACFEQDEETAVEEGATGGNIPSYFLEVSSAAEDSDGIETEYERAGNKTKLLLHIRHEGSYSSCSGISTTNETIREPKKEATPSCESSSHRPQTVSLSSILSDISSGSIAYSSDNNGRNYQDDETGDDATDVDNQSGEFNLEDRLSMKPSECKRYTLKELRLMQKLPASKIIPKVEERARFLLKERMSSSMRNMCQPFSRSFGVNQRQGKFVRHKYSSGRKSTRRSAETYTARSNDPPQLNEISNAWRPKKLRKSSELTPEMQAQEELFQNVRGILNKLTKDKFDVLVEQILDLAIDTKEKIYGVMLLIFEKAIDEPHFSQSYAMLCRRLVERQLHVKSNESTEPIGSKEEVSSKVILFKTALLDKTQSEFFRNVVDQKTKYEKLKPIMKKIECCQNAEKAAELKMLLDEREKLYRLRSVGTVKFIGELYRISMLTPSIITNCIQCLLDANCDHKLECLCKLLTTVGEKYETTLLHEKTNKYYSLKDTFKKISEIITLKRNCNRVRFMLLDMVDTRNKWLPKLKELKSKTTTDSVEPSKTVEPPIKIVTSESGRNKFDGLNTLTLPSNTQSGVSLERAKAKNFGRANKVGPQEQIRLEAMIRENSAVAPPFDVTKLGAVRATTSMPSSIGQTENLILGNSSCFKWHRDPKIDNDVGRSMPLLPQFQRTPRATLLQHFSFKKPSKEMATPDLSDTKPSRTFGDGANEEKCIELCKTTIIHMVTTAIEDSLQDAIELLEKISPGAYTTFVYSIFSIYLHSGGVKQEQRKKAAEIVQELMRLGRLREENLVGGYQRFSEEISDLILDVPDAWSYIFEFLGPIIESGYINLRQLWNEELKTARMEKKFLKHLLQYFIGNGCQKSIVKMWRESKLQWTEFLAENEVREFIEENNFGFIDEVQEENKAEVIDEIQKEQSVQEENKAEVIDEIQKEQSVQEENKAEVIDEIQKEQSVQEENKAEVIDEIQKEQSVERIPTELSSVKKPALNMRVIFTRLESKIKEERRPESIIGFIHKNIPAPVDLSFITVLTNWVIKAAMMKNRKHLKVDRTKLMKFSVPILKNSIDKNRSFEMAALEAIQSLTLNGECPPGNLTKIFHSLFNAKVVRKETFIKWRSLQGEPMKKILSGAGMMSFYNMLNADGSSSEG